MPSKKSGGRKVGSTNFTLIEDEVLSKAWCDTSLDSNGDADQIDLTYWERISVKYHELIATEEYKQKRKPPESKDTSQLQSRWSKIRKEVALFCKDFEQAGQEDSDLSEPLQIAAAERQFSSEGAGKNPRFNQIASWRALRGNDKWKQVLEKGKRKADSPATDNIPTTSQKKRHRVEPNKSTLEKATTDDEEAAAIEKKLDEACSRYHKLVQEVDHLKDTVLLSVDPASITDPLQKKLYKLMMEKSIYLLQQEQERGWGTATSLSTAKSSSTEEGSNALVSENEE